ncbi:uncharacterized protein YecE (DUF72 family) [Bradyrhizobium elkanii]
MPFVRRELSFAPAAGHACQTNLFGASDEIYLRLHGPMRWYRHDYSRKELAIWAERIRAIGAKRAWIYFNNDNDAYAPKNAATLRRMLTAILRL